MSLILMKYPKNLIKNRLELNVYSIIKLAQSSINNKLKTYFIDLMMFVLHKIINMIFFKILLYLFIIKYLIWKMFN